MLHWLFCLEMYMIQRTETFCSNNGRVWFSFSFFSVFLSFFFFFCLSLCGHAPGTEKRAKYSLGCLWLLTFQINWNRHTCVRHMRSCWHTRVWQWVCTVQVCKCAQPTSTYVFLILWPECQLTHSFLWSLWPTLAWVGDSVLMADTYLYIIYIVYTWEGDTECT